MKKPIFFSAHDKNSTEAERLLREAKIEFIFILANDVDEPTLVTRESAYSYKGLNEIKEYIEFHKPPIVFLDEQGNYDPTKVPLGKPGKEGMPLKF